MCMKGSCRKTIGNNQIPNEQPAFGCEPDFVSRSQSLAHKLFSLCFYKGPICEPLGTLWKRYFLITSECFSLFSTMRTHAQECIRWSKYTTARSANVFHQQIAWRVSLNRNRLFKEITKIGVIAQYWPLFDFVYFCGCYIDWSIDNSPKCSFYPAIHFSKFSRESGCGLNPSSPHVIFRNQLARPF